MCPDDSKDIPIKVGGLKVMVVFALNAGDHSKINQKTGNRTNKDEDEREYKTNDIGHGDLR